jgi:hypothetical protein
MIEQNKYSPETIHVANWLLLSGEVDLDKLIAKATVENAKDLHQCVSLAALAEAEFIEAWETLTDYVYQDTAASYDVCKEDYEECDSYNALIGPMILSAARNVDWAGVAALLLAHHRTTVNAAA